MIFKLNFQRTFSSSSAIFRQWRLVECRRVAKKPIYQVGDPKPAFIPKTKKKFPDYPYGESLVFKQSNKGLYGASFIQFGNNVSESKAKTRRQWLPNIIRKGLWSETLGRNIKIRMTAKVLRTITKEGGIDNYLIKEKSARIKELGPTGWKLRYRILTTKEKKLNPPHKDAVLVKDSHGNEIKVFYEETVNGNLLRVTKGRRKLMRFLYPLEKLEYKADGKKLDFKEFLRVYENSSVNLILSNLQKYGFDMKSITI